MIPSCYARRHLLIVALFTSAILTAGPFDQEDSQVFRPWVHRDSNPCEQGAMRLIITDHTQWIRAAPTGGNPRWLTNLRHDSMAWKSYLLRDPIHEQPRPHFLENALVSIQRVFGPWWNRRLDIPFEEMLDRQYLTLVLGVDGNSIYSGITVARSPHVLLLARHRQQLLGDDVGPLIYPFVAERVFGQDADRTLRPFLLGMPIEIEGIPESGRPQVKAIRDTLHVHFPEPRSLTHYAKRMAYLAEEIRLHLRPEGPLDRRVSDLIADYFQLGVFAHFFPIGNTSLYQSQIAFLVKMGATDLPELGFLDHQAYIRSSHDFRNYFWDKVRSSRDAR